MPTKKYKREQIATPPRQFGGEDRQRYDHAARLPGSGNHRADVLLLAPGAPRIESGPGQPGTSRQARSSFQATSDEASQQNQPCKMR
jgi:hypothetical protein